MTYDRMATLITFGGDFSGATGESWQCGLHLAQTPLLDAPGLPEPGELTSLHSVIGAFIQADPLYLAAAVRHRWTKAATLDANGRYTAEPVYVDDDLGHHGAQNLPWKGGPQVSLVVTLWSGATLGEANYGRIYLPWCEAAVGAGGRMTPEVATAMAATASGFIDDVNDWASGVLTATTRVVIMSKKGSGRTRRPTQVKIGDVKDTQQRRRRQIPETYVASAVAA